MITDLIRELVIYGKNNGLICEADEVYATNRLLELFDVMEYEENPEITESRAVCEILEDMMTYAHENGIMKEDTITAKDLFDTKIMGCITPPPSVVRAEFAKRYAESPKEATNYYYQFSQATNYIRKDRIAKDEKWVTDITELKYGSGSKAYLSAVLDLYGRNIVAFSLSRRNNTPLVLDTFEQAFQKYPDAKPLLHSDRGVQYTSRSFRKEMKRAGVCQSMSRVGRCLDNAPMEGFWGILKTEMYYLYHFEDYETLRKTICAYIDFYNNDRYQKKLGCMTPAEFIAASAK